MMFIISFTLFFSGLYLLILKKKPESKAAQKIKDLDRFPLWLCYIFIAVGLAIGVGVGVYIFV